MTNAHQVTGKRVKEYDSATGRNDGLCQDYNGNLGRWFADRLSARNDIRRAFNMTKNIEELNTSPERVQKTPVNEHELPVVDLSAAREAIAMRDRRIANLQSDNLEWMKYSVAKGKRIAEMEAVVKQSKRALCASANVCSGESLSKSALIRALELSRDALKSIESLGINLKQ